MKLAEDIALRAGDKMIPWIAAGKALPLAETETVSPARDGQESIRCELVVGGQSLAWLEVAVARAPRGVARAALELRIDDDGSANAWLRSEHGEASASFSVRVA